MYCVATHIRVFFTRAPTNHTQANQVMFFFGFLVHNRDMATVYLPFGYPQLSGTPFQTVIYQGTVCRLYTVPNDPRTASQLFERRLFADMGKMRKTMGSWARGAARAALGSSWSTNLLQLIKADDGQRWQDAELMWDEDPQQIHDEWNAVAPFTATFNEPGRVFFLMVRVLMDTLIDFTGLQWGGYLFGTTDWTDALAWWNKDISDAFQGGLLQENAAQAEIVGYWDRFAVSGANGGYIGRNAYEASARWRVYWEGKSATITYWRPTDGWNAVPIYLDGVLHATLNQYYNPATFGQSVVSAEKSGLHCLELRGHANHYVNIDCCNFS